MSAQTNWVKSIRVVPSSRRRASIWVVRMARTVSPMRARFICLLLKVSIVKTEAVSLRHSTAATTRHSANAVKAIDVPMASLP